MKKLLLCMLAIMTSLLFITGCNMGGPKDPGDEDPTTGDLTLTIDSDAGYGATYFLISHTTPDSTTTQDPVAGTTVSLTELDPGVHTFDIEARNVPHGIVGEGSGSVTIVAGETATLTVTISDPAAGTLVLTINYPAGWAVDHTVLSDTRPDAIVDSYTLTAGSTQTINDLLVGDHELSIRAYDAGGVLLGTGETTASVPEGSSVSATIDADVNFVKYYYIDETNPGYENFNYDGNGISICERDIDGGEAAPGTMGIWTYESNLPAGACGQYVWAIDAVSVPGDGDYGDHLFGFGIDTFNPDTEWAAIDEAGETLVFDAGQSDLATGLLVFTGYETVPLSTGGSTSIITKLTVIVEDEAGSAVVLEDPANYGLDAGLGGVYSIPIGEDMQIEIIMQASDDAGSSWDKAITYYNLANTPPDAAAEVTRTIIDIGAAMYVME